jgi:hypothetical protein
MILSPDLKTKLDRFAPFGSGLGAIIGLNSIWISIYSYRYLYSIGVVGPTANISNEFFIAPIISYILCTCTHRKTVIYSNAALVGAIASFFGVVFGLDISVVLFGPLELSVVSGLMANIIAFFSAFFPARYMCRRDQRKEREPAEQ